MSATTPADDRAANSARLQRLMRDAETRGAVAALRKYATALENDLNNGGRIVVPVRDVVLALRASAYHLESNKEK
jgi:hypothetical protein